MTDLPELDAVEQRVLGCLLEKQVTVPATYPLTLNALRSACNQTSSRDPIMDLDERTVDVTARALRDRGLLRIVWADTGRRVLKYHQTLVDVLGLAADERALITVLLLRGAQTPGELKARTERLHPFPDREAVVGIVHRGAGRVGAHVHHDMAQRLELALEALLQLEACVVGADRDLHPSRFAGAPQREAAVPCGTGVSQPCESGTSPRTCEKYAFCSAFVTGPTVPLPTGILSTDVMGVTSTAVPV